MVWRTLHTLTVAGDDKIGQGAENDCLAAQIMERFLGFVHQGMGAFPSGVDPDRAGECDLAVLAVRIGWLAELGGIAG